MFTIFTESYHAPCAAVIILGLVMQGSFAVADIRSASVAEVSGENAATGESVTALSKRGQHYEALQEFLTKEVGEASLAEKNAAARSAWALGLVDKARKIWDEVLAHEDFEGLERQRTMLARAILELQEGQYETARAFAEKAVRKLDASPLRSQLWLVIAESLKEQELLSNAEDYYKKAAEEGSGNLKYEALLLLGECQTKLGLISEARHSFTDIPVSSPFTAKALRELIALDFADRDYDGVLTWISEGLENYPLSFNDPWVYYAHVIALVEVGSLDQAEKLLKKFKAHHSGSDTWYVLAETRVEGQLVVEYHPRARLNDGIDRSLKNSK